MKHSLANIARKVLGRRAHFLRLDAAPVDHIVKPLEKVHAGLVKHQSQHSELICRNKAEMHALERENERRSYQLMRAEKVRHNLAALLDV